MKALKDILTPQARRYLYRVAIAVLVLLGALGVVSDELYGPIVGLVTALLALGIAEANVPTPKEEAALERVKETEDLG